MSKNSHEILIVDDDLDILHTARVVLKPHFKKIQITNKPEDIDYLINKNSFNVVLLDMNFSPGNTTGQEGLKWLKFIKKQTPSTIVIMMTAYGDINLAVNTMKEGASDFIVKPWDNDILIETIHKAIQNNQEKTSSTSGISTQTTKNNYDIIGQSEAIQKVFLLIDKVAKTDANVLILGENGTGKGLIAKALHHKSQRQKKAFVNVDLGAISESLFESELFGHQKGAFTDAKENRKGRFETANTGTLFLDEIGNLSLPLQAKLLTALQSRKITPIGSNKEISVDIRLICATNMDLHQMIAEKSFRQDLMYRVNTVEIYMPPLRERLEDIPLLVDYYLEKYGQQYQKDNLKLSTKALKKLQQYHWAGNIRELQHAVERAIIMCDAKELQPDDFQLNISQPKTNTKLEGSSLEDVEKETIKNVLAKHNGNVSKSAQELGLGRNTLYRKIYKYGL